MSFKQKRRVNNRQRFNMRTNRRISWRCRRRVSIKNNESGKGKELVRRVKQKTYYEITFHVLLIPVALNEIIFCRGHLSAALRRRHVVLTSQHPN